MPRAGAGPGRGEAADPTAALKLAAAEVAAGAGGVVFGRNAIQVADPHAFQAALCDVVKDVTRPRRSPNTN